MALVKYNISFVKLFQVIRCCDAGFGCDRETITRVEPGTRHPVRVNLS
jgi:hypothetical protein